MQVQPSQGLVSFGYVKEALNKGLSEEFFSSLKDEDEKKASGKPRFEVKSEGGYIRKYVVKANGDKILVMETKQTMNPDGTRAGESGDLVDMAYDLMMNQLEFSSDIQKRGKQNGSVWETENGLFKYKNGI